jgi:predicted GNAT family N-acyltransferase
MDKANAAREIRDDGSAGRAEGLRDIGKAAFEPGVYSPDGSFVFIKKPPEQDLHQLHEIAVAEIGPNVAPFEVIKSVYETSPLSMWGLYRSNDEQRLDSRMIGFIAYLPLSEDGNAALRAHKVDGTKPDLSLLAKPGEEPTVLYLWAIATPGLGNLAFMLNGRAIGPDLFEKLPIIGWISTQSALDSVKRSSKTKEYADAKIGSTFEIKFPKEYRSEMRALKVIEGTKPGAQVRPRQKIDIKLVANGDQMDKVMAIRAAVFMIEQNCPYDEEFDGNDYCSAHLLGTINGEPAAVLRMRYFAEFAKIERLAVLPRFRRTLIAKQIVEQGIDICRRKGYNKLYGHAQMRLAPFWSRFGFRPMDKPKFAFSDHEYIEMDGDFPPHEKRVTLQSDPLVIVRPEGKWDEPGVLDKSTSRPVTNPH